jgi:hypothetical protein
MQLVATQPGISQEQVQQATGFALEPADSVSENPEPSPEELEILREQVDRERFYI